MIKATLLTRRSQYGGAKFRAENGQESWLQVPADIVLTGGECMIELTPDGKGITSFVNVEHVNSQGAGSSNTSEAHTSSPRLNSPDTNRMIVRQNVLNRAVELVCADKITLEQLKSTAEDLEAWVFRDK